MSPRLGFQYLRHGIQILQKLAFNTFSVVVDGCISIINDQRFTGIIESKSAGLSMAKIIIFSQTFFSGQKSVRAVEAANVLFVTGINSNKTKKYGSEYEFHDCKV